MPAFERIESGFQGLDDALDSIRLGDNVVWQVSQLEDYSFFYKTLCSKSDRAKKKCHLRKICTTRIFTRTHRRPKNLFF